MGKATWLTVGLVLVLAACGDAAGPATTGATAPATVATTSAPAPTTLPATTIPATTVTTSTTTATTTSTPAPPEYAFPVQPPEVADYGPDHHDYPATDIFAPEGSLLVAVTAGVVDETSRSDPWDPAVDDPATRGGRYVSIVGDDGVRYYYSHLLTVAAGIEAGARVTPGQVIGAVGRSGNAASTPPHVHFGISPPTGPGDWEVRRGVVPPYDYLQDWAAGIASTPPLP